MTTENTTAGRAAGIDLDRIEGRVQRGEYVTRAEQQALIDLARATPAQNGEQAGVSEADMQAMARSQHNICRATENNLKHALHVALNEIIAIHEAVGFDPDDTVDAEKIIEWIKQARAQPLASTAATQPEQASIKTWQERVTEKTGVENPHYRDWPNIVLDELLDLRAALAIPASPTRIQHEQAKCKTCYGAGLIGGTSLEDQEPEFCPDCIPASTAASEQQAGAVSIPYGYVAPFQVETDKHDVVSIWDATRNSLPFELNTHTQRSLDDKDGLAEERREAEALAHFIADAMNRAATLPSASEDELALLSLADDPGFRLALSKYNVGELSEAELIVFLDGHTKQAALAHRATPAATLPSVSEDERELFEATMGAALLANQGEYALTRAYSEGNPYTFLATMWAYKAWQAARALTHRAAPADATASASEFRNLLSINRHGDQSAVLVFTSARACSAFIRQADAFKRGRAPAPSRDAAVCAAITRLERQDSTYDERIAAADGLRAIAQQGAAQGDVAWGAVHTVGDMVRNLLTLDQSGPIHAAYHVDIDGARRCRTRPVMISRERVIDGKWVDPSRIDVPYANIVWANPDERAAQAQAGDELKRVLDEVARATRKFPTWPTDPLHAVAVLGEEFGELTKAVLQTTYEPHKVADGELRTEAIQTAAMALRFVASLAQYEFTRCIQHSQAVDAAMAAPATGADSYANVDPDPDPLDDLVDVIDLGKQRGNDLPDSEGGHHD